MVLKDVIQKKWSEEIVLFNQNSAEKADFG